MLKKFTKKNIKKLFTIKGFKFLLKKLYQLIYLIALFMVLLLGLFLVYKCYYARYEKIFYIDHTDFGRYEQFFRLGKRTKQPFSMCRKQERLFEVEYFYDLYRKYYYDTIFWRDKRIYDAQDRELLSFLREKKNYRYKDVKKSHPPYYYFRVLLRSFFQKRRWKQMIFDSQQTCRIRDPHMIRPEHINYYIGREKTKPPKKYELLESRFDNPHLIAGDLETTLEEIEKQRLRFSFFRTDKSRGYRNTKYMGKYYGMTKMSKKRPHPLLDLYLIDSRSKARARILHKTPSLRGVRRLGVIKVRPRLSGGPAIVKSKSFVKFVSEKPYRSDLTRYRKPNNLHKFLMNEGTNRKRRIRMMPELTKSYRIRKFVVK